MNCRKYELLRETKHTVTVKVGFGSRRIHKCSRSEGVEVATVYLESYKAREAYVLALKDDVERLRDMLTTREKELNKWG